jgi:enamine deaminase RidA (YjgF/YER057c/UK114 family)
MPKGPVPATVTFEEASEAAAQCFMNGLAAALSVIEDDETLQLIQMQGFVQCTPGFDKIPQVIDGASELAMKVLEADGTHARTAVGVSALPKNAPVEIAFIYQVKKINTPKFEGRYAWL